MPAPYRYVITKPGGPYGIDPEDSTDLGSWFQPDDQPDVRISTVIFDDAIDTLDPKAENNSGLAQDEPTPVDLYPADFYQMATTLHGGFAGLPIGDASSLMKHQTWHMQSGTLGDDDPFYFAHTNEGTRTGNGRPVAAHLADTFDCWTPSSWPADAIGYEVDMVEVEPGVWGPWADPVRLDLQVTIEPSVYFGTHWGGIFVRVQVTNADGTNDIRFALTGLESDGSPLNAIPDNAAPGVVTYAELLHLVHDRGPSEVGVPGKEPSVHDVVIEDFSIPYTGLVGAWWGPSLFDEFSDVTVTVDGAPDWAIEVNSNVTLAGSYTVRPPRIRWIYGRAPYRRLTQRADGRAGGARRIHPRPKTIQGSNRRGAGSIT